MSDLAAGLVQRVLLWMEVHGHKVDQTLDIDCQDWWDGLLAEFDHGAGDMSLLGSGFYSAAFQMRDDFVLKIGFKGERDAGKDYARWCRAHNTRLNLPAIHHLETVTESVWYLVTNWYSSYDEAMQWHVDEGMWGSTPKDYWLLASHVLEGGHPEDENYAPLLQGDPSRNALIETMVDMRDYFKDTATTDLHQLNILFECLYDFEGNATCWRPIINDPLSAGTSSSVP